MTLRRLLLAFVISIVLGFVGAATSQAASFQSRPFGGQESSSPALLWHYDEAATFSSASHSGFNVAVVASGAPVSSRKVRWTNTPSLSGTDAADSSGLLDQATAARNGLANDVGATKATVTGGYNTETGQVAAGSSGGPLGCAENCVVDQLGGDPSKIGFTQAIRPRTGLEVPICAACQSIYSPDQFPVGTQFDEGPWLPWWEGG